MKHFVYIIICVVIIGIGSLFVLESPKGKPWLSFSDFYNHNELTYKANDFKNTVKNDVAKLFNSTASLIDGNSNETIYKWQDDKGGWHYSDKKQENSETWIKPENIMVIPAIKPLKPKETYPSQNTKKTLTNTTSGNKIEKLISDTNNVQKLMDNRTKMIDKQLEKY